jgi:hypothetical protein
MLAYLDQRNLNPKPFVWTADADLILVHVRRFPRLTPWAKRLTPLRDSRTT